MPVPPSRMSLPAPAEERVVAGVAEQRVAAIVAVDEVVVGPAVEIVAAAALGLFATYEYRHYFERIVGDFKNRRDHVLAPGAQLILTSLFVDQLDVVGSYTYELRNSNDGLQNYNNHMLSLRWIWRF